MTISKQPSAELSCHRCGAFFTDKFRFSIGSIPFLLYLIYEFGPGLDVHHFVRFRFYFINILLAILFWLDIDGPIFLLIEKK